MPGALAQFWATKKETIMTIRTHVARFHGELPTFDILGSAEAALAEDPRDHDAISGRVDADQRAEMLRARAERAEQRRMVKEAMAAFGYANLRGLTLVRLTAGFGPVPPGALAFVAPGPRDQGYEVQAFMAANAPATDLPAPKQVEDVISEVNTATTDKRAAMARAVEELGLTVEFAAALADLDAARDDAEAVAAASELQRQLLALWREGKRRGDNGNP